MPPNEPKALDSAGAARICMPTSRNLSRMAFQCGYYEAEDVLARMDDVDLIRLEPARGFRFKEKWQRRLLYKDLTGKLAYANPGLQPVRLTKDYDLFVVFCASYWELLHANAIEGWKDHCKTSVCWLDEIYAAAVPSYKYWLPSLDRFDHIIIGKRGSVNAVSGAVGKSCHYIPGAVDMLRFSPYPNPPPRVIDVYSIGRRCEGVHQALRTLSAKTNLFYLYDTLKGGDTPVSDPAEHRDLFASVAKRSGYFMVAPGKVDATEETQGQIELGFRFFEGAAAGAVMIGQAPRGEPSFRQMFDWRDAVIEIKPDGSDVVEVLADLAGQPERLREIRRRNAAEALLRHDWLYRWKEILAIAGLKPAPALEAREKRLQELADLAGRDLVG